MEFLLSETLRQSKSSSFRVENSPDGTMTVHLPEKLDISSTGSYWRKLNKKEIPFSGTSLILDASEVHFCDGAGIALLFALEEIGRQHHMQTRIQNLSPDFQSLLERFDPKKLAETLKEPLEKSSAIEEIGKTAVHLLDDICQQLTFLGKWLCALGWTLCRPHRIRWRDFFRLVELVGVNAVGITILLGLLFGLIMAFSSAMPLRRFGVEVYVADLVAIAMVRVLGPFITAIIIAGRTGSAFAAELGTMKINNELDALDVMGLEPMRFLVVPRVMSTILMAPLLTVLTNFAGLAGSALVILSLGYNFATYYDHVQYILDAKDVIVGIFKATVFGGLVGGVGCLRGIQTQLGAGAVGISTTRAVVSGIVWIVVAEGIFSVLLYILEI
jgi:phospholipid/cholesterol/gamma-HCH transport system permease protein